MENQKDISPGSRIESLLQLGSDLSVWFNSANNLVEALQLILDSFCSIDGIDTGGIYVINKNNSNLELLVHYGLNQEFIQAVGCYKTDSYNYKMIATGKAAFVPVIDIQDNIFKEIVSKSDIISLAALPLIFENKLVGCINLSSKSLRRYEPDIQHILITLAAQVASLIGRFSTQDNLVKMFRALEQIPEAVLFTNIKGEIEYVNPKFCEITGYSVAEVLGKNPNIQKSGRMNREDYKKMWDSILSGNIWRGEILNRKKNNELYWESVSISTVFDNDTRIVGFVGIKEDITNKKALQEALIKAKELAEESNIFKSTLLNSLSNEIRPPLNEIVEAIQILGSQIKDKNQTALLESAMVHGKSLFNALDSILLLAQLTDPIELSLENIDIRSLLSDVTADKQKKYSGDGVDFIFTPSSVVHFVSADKRLLTLAFDKIFENIHKQFDGGNLYIDLSKELSDEKCNVVIKVQSSGLSLKSIEYQDVKINMGKHPHPFDGKFEMNSLEFNIAVKIFEIFKGTLAYQRTKNNNIEFKISLPSVEQRRTRLNYISKTQSNQEIPELSDLILEFGRIPKVLLVEDNDMNAMLVHSMLNKSCKISHVKNGDKALELVGNDQFDMVLMDINLGPGLNGLQVTQEIRKHKNYSSVPVTAVTGYNLNDEMEKIFQAGIDYYLGKPFKKEELIYSVRTMLHDLLQQNKA